MFDRYMVMVVLYVTNANDFCLYAYRAILVTIIKTKTRIINSVFLEYENENY